MRYLLILLITAKIFSQDYLITISGKSTQGKYINIADTHVEFQQKGVNVVSKIPLSVIKSVTLADGTVVYEMGELSEKIQNALNDKAKANLLIHSIIGNKTSMMYHTGNVMHLPDDNDREIFSSIIMAENENYVPCTACFDTRLPITDYYFEKDLSRSVNASIRTQYEIIYEHKELERINSISKKILDNWVDDLVGYDYRILVLNDDEPNAFAVAGGHIYLTTGMLKLIENEFELEFILAHEIAHVERRHTIRQFRNQQKLELFSKVFSAVAGVGLLATGSDISDVNMVMDLADIISKFGILLVLRGYSRDLEQESDIYAQVYASKQSVDKTKLTYALDKLATRSIRLGHGISANSFSSHPSLSARIEQIINSELIQLDNPIIITADKSSPTTPKRSTTSGKPKQVIKPEGLPDDFLVSISGKKSKGYFIEFTDDKAIFQVEGTSFPSKIPINSVKEVILTNGKVLKPDRTNQKSIVIPKRENVNTLISLTTDYLFIAPSSSKKNNHVITFIGNARNHSDSKDLSIKSFHFTDYGISNRNISSDNMKSFSIQRKKELGYTASFEIISEKVDEFLEKLNARNIKTTLSIEKVVIKPGEGAKKQIGYSGLQTITYLK